MLFVNKIFETKPLTDMVQDDPPTGGKMIQPSFKISSKVTNPIIRDLIIDSLLSSWHSLGTCSMLPEEDGGVVNT